MEERLTPEREFTEVALDTLGSDVLFLIFERLTPEAVFALCRVSRAFERYCRKESLWRRLIQAHFPYDFLTDNPREQYKALRADEITVYSIVNNLKDSNFVYLIADPETVREDLVIGGLPLPENTRGWVLGWHYSHSSFVSSDYVNDNFGFPTEEIALQHFRNITFFVALDALKTIADGYLARSDSIAVNQIAAQLQLPTPVTAENWTNYLRDYGSISFEDFELWSDRTGETRVLIAIDEVVFRNKAP